MVSGQFSFGLCTACVFGLFSVGCLSKKTEEVASEGAAPPPAAYPESSAESYGDSANSNSPYRTAPQSSPASAQEPSPPAFQLRSGEQLVEHKIKSGENLSVIASKYNSSVRRIQAANGMSNTKIYAGKTIQVPTSAPPNLAMSAPQTSSPAPAAPVAASTSYGEGGRYGAIRPQQPTSSPGVYPSTTTVPTPQAPAYPTTTAPAAPSKPAYSGPAGGSTERIPSPPVQVPSSPSSTSYPPQTGAAFPTPNLGGGGSSIQFSD